MKKSGMMSVGTIRQTSLGPLGKKIQVELQRAFEGSVQVVFGRWFVRQLEKFVEDF